MDIPLRRCRILYNAHSQILHASQLRLESTNLDIPVCTKDIVYTFQTPRWALSFSTPLCKNPLRWPPQNFISFRNLLPRTLLINSVLYFFPCHTLFLLSFYTNLSLRFVFIGILKRKFKRHHIAINHLRLFGKFMLKRRFHLCEKLLALHYF